MSDSQAYEEVSVASDGVTVVKRFEEDEFPVPAIAFEFSSEREEAVAVRLRDTVPDSVAVEDLGFHPEYGSEYWTIDENEITFERELEAESGYTTVYGIRATGTDDVEKFLTRPEIVEVDPPLPEEEKEAAPANDGGEDVIPESDDDVVRDVIAGESEDVPGLEEEDSDEEIETLDLKDPNDDGASASSASSGGQTADSGDGDSGDDGGDSSDTGTTETTGTTGTTGSVSLDGESIVTALATELRENEVSAEDVKLLRQAFEIAGQEGGSIQARVERIQSDIANLRAYADAMEEFLDENGTAQQLIEDFESDIENLESTVSSMQSTVEDNDEQVSAISDEVSSLGDDVAEVGDEIDAVSEDVADVEETVSGVEGSVDDVEGTVADLESAMTDVEDTVAELEDQVTDGDAAERIEALESELEDLQTWQDQIKETFGG